MFRNIYYLELAKSLVAQLVGVSYCFPLRHVRFKSPMHKLWINLFEIDVMCLKSMHKLWINFSFNIQHHLMQSFVSRIQSTKVLFQRKQRSRSNWLYIEDYQEIDVGQNDFGTKVILSSKIYIIWSWPKAL